MDIKKFFDVKSSKKIFLSNEQSQTGDERKKQKEEVEMNLQAAL